MSTTQHIFDYRFVTRKDAENFPFIYNDGDTQSYYTAHEELIKSLMRSNYYAIVDVRIDGIWYRWFHPQHGYYHFRSLELPIKK